MTETLTPIGPTPPTRDDVNRATQHTADTIADPSAGMAARLAAADAEAATFIAFRHAGRHPDVIPINSRARQGRLEATHELEAGG
jgi:hypothetical protein